MKFNLVILVFLIMAISSCCAPKAHNKREKNVTNELSFINNKSINFSIKKVACDTCFPIFIDSKTRQHYNKDEEKRMVVSTQR